jgi:predicted ATP-dependent endonuclease of OLD family
MKLIHIYVNEHKILQNINVAISSGFDCHFSNGLLKIEKKNSLKEYYLNVHCTALIGQNGVGKSSLLEFIESCYSISDSSGLLVWHDDLNDKYHICPINCHIDKVVSDDVHSIENSPVSFLNKNKIRLVKSNNLAGLEKSLINKPTSNNKKIFDLQYSTTSKMKAKQKIHRLLSFFNDSNWFTSLHDTKVEFNFKFRASSTSYLNSQLKTAEIKDKFPKLVDMVESISEKNLTDINFEFDAFAELWSRNLPSIAKYLASLSFIPKKYKNEFFLKLLNMFIHRKGSIEEVKEILVSVIDNWVYKEMDHVAEMDSFAIEQRYNFVINCFSEIANLISENYSSRRNQANQISSSNVEFIFNLTSMINNLPPNIRANFEYGWEGFSTGEFAKLNLFSELFHFINNDKRDKEKENYLVVMDEVDLYLHPEWQRSFLSELLSFISDEFVNTNTQLILTTHSPIIIGDFLPEDIVSLNKKDGVVSISKSYGFGTQINDLYLQGMHLSSTFGDHSKKAIKTILANRNSNELTSYDRELIKRIPSQNIKSMLLNTND